MSNLLCLQSFTTCFTDTCGTMYTFKFLLVNFCGSHSTTKITKITPSEKHPLYGNELTVGERLNVGGRGCGFLYTDTAAGTVSPTQHFLPIGGTCTYTHTHTHAATNHNSGKKKQYSFSTCLHNVMYMYVHRGKNLFSDMQALGYSF